MTTFKPLPVMMLLGLGACAYASPAAHTSKHTPAPAARVESIRATPSMLTLSGAYTEGHLLLDGRDATGAVRDISALATLKSSDPKVVSVDPDRVLRPHHNGKAVITAGYNGVTCTVPVTISGITVNPAPSFLKDVIPVLTHAGCNMGACHGAAAGKGGFRLSLLGYDPDLDFESITRQAGARRIAKSQPENSLLLRKPTFATPHRGGKRLDVGSAEYRILTDWIAAGCPGPIAKEPRVVTLKVVPEVRTLAVGQSQQFTVQATYSDKSVRDATGETIFTASDETTATVSASGVAKATGPGEGAVVVRYQGLVATARVISPFSAAVKGGQIKAATSDTTATIDRMVNAKLSALGLTPSPSCTDGDFIRRVTLDLTGQLPDAAITRAFLADRDPEKRTKRIDSLLAGSAYIDFWTLKWADLLRCTRDALTDKGMYTMNAWIRNAVDTNMPWDQFARQIIVSTGDTYKNGPVNFYKAATSPEDRAEAVSQVFLGVRISCAKCHNHPYDRWTQNQYYQMAAFFARVSSKKSDEKGQLTVFAADSGEMRNPKSQQTVAPCALIDSVPIPETFAGDRREALADWMTSPRNPFFTHILVNRIWKSLLGIGFVEAVDDLKATSPPSNGPLFDYLARDFSDHKFDVKRLIRSICLSETYQRSAVPNKTNGADKRFYSHYPIKRLSAEQMLDALSTSTGVPEKFAGYPLGMHAAALPDAQTPSYFLDLFGRPARTTTCACERLDDPNLSQVLHLMNGADVNTRLASKTGKITELLDAKLPDKRVIDELYLTCYSRYPTDTEAKRALASFARAKEKRNAMEDLEWALINSNEFLFNH